MKTWLTELTLDQSLSHLRELALFHCSRGGIVGEQIAAFVSAGDYRSLILYELDYEADWDVNQLINCRQALALFQKLEPVEAGFDKESAAMVKYEEAERRCRETNQFLRHAYGDRTKFCPVPRLVTLIESARRKIKRVLGTAPAISELKIGFGPGATTATKRIDACPMNKMGSGIQCSDELAHSLYLRPLLRELPHWTSSVGSRYGIDDEGWLYELVTLDLHPGRLQFVPKNAKTYRPIQVEPVLNSVLQRGIGKYMDKRLKAFGLDIHDQSRNARLARKGSLDGSLATLDLSSASDLIAFELVRLMLPADWFELLNAARTGTVIYGSKSLSLQKFSSMGNGFTFPLETLLFWAITVSSSPLCEDSEKVGIYGDDIIVPTGAVDEVIQNLSLCGFLVNQEKSFWRGSFRESCGKDYYKGIAVRPFYQKKLISGETAFTLHNFYQRNYDCEAARRVLNWIPRHLRIYGPDGYGDGHLVSDVYPRTYSKKLLKKGYGGYCFDTYSHIGRRVRTRFPGDYVSPLYNLYVLEDVPLTERPSVWVNPDTGYPYWDLPGSSGYKRQAIYTLG